LRRAGTLADPDGATIAALRRLAWVAAARLGAGSPPLGDRGPAGIGALLLAAAVGGRLQSDAAAAILDAVPAVRLRQPGAWAECLVRHAVLAPAVAAPGATSGAAPGAVPDELTEALLRASPLTAVLHRPPSAAVSTARGTAVGLVGRPGGAGVLAAALSAPATDLAVLRWRAQLLNLLGRQHTEAALDVYVAARLWHGPAWDERIRWAGRELRGLGLPGELPIETLRYWAPLARLHHAERLGSRIYLRLQDYGPAVALVDRYDLMRAAA
jgi:hypothetical protein